MPDTLIEQPGRVPMTERSSTDAACAHLLLLVLRCQAGDEGAFAQLMTEYGPRTLRYLGSLVGGSADDVQQEVWLTVYRSIATVAQPGAFRTWLYRIARNRAMDFLRKQNRERELVADAAEELRAGAVIQTDRDAVAFTDEVLAAIDRLPVIQREVLLLRYRDDMSYAGIALVVGCPVGTVRSRLHAAKQRLQELVNPASQPQ